MAIISSSKSFQAVDVVRLKSEIEALGGLRVIKIAGDISGNTEATVLLSSGSPTLSPEQIDSVGVVILNHSNNQSKRILVEEDPALPVDAANKRYVDQILAPDASIENVLNNFSSSFTIVAGTLTLNLSLGKVFLGSLSDSVSTWNLQNAPLENGKATSITLVISGNSTRTYGDACSINGSSVVGGIIWTEGVPPVATDGTDIITLILIKDNSGEIKVFGNSILNLN